MILPTRSAIAPMTTVAEHTPIVTFQDILNALARPPILKEQLRQHVQDEALCNLPETVDSLQDSTEAHTADVNEGQSGYDADRAEIEAGSARQDIGQPDIHEVQRRILRDINRLASADYERRIARNIRRNSLRYFGISSAQLVQSVTIPEEDHLILDLLDMAHSQGVIQPNEADNAYMTNIVIQGQDSANQSAYVAIEASVTIEDRDIIKARQRADIISKATGLPTSAAVCGSRIDDATSALAGEYDVTIIIVQA